MLFKEKKLDGSNSINVFGFKKNRNGNKSNIGFTKKWNKNIILAVFHDFISFEISLIL